MKKKLRIIYNYDTCYGRDVWDIFSEGLADHSEWLQELTVYGKSVKLEKISKYLMRHAHFSIENKCFEFGFGRDGGYKFDDLILQSGVIPIPLLEEIAMNLVRYDKGIYGWLVDGEYQVWQNATSLDYYNRRGRSIDGLPLCSNGKPKPLTEMIVDTTQNPGRNVFHEGYIETVGGIMWFTDEFFRVTGCDKDALLRVPFVKTDEHDGILKVVLDEDLLAHAEGDQEMAVKQYTLRAILFPRTA